MKRLVIFIYLLFYCCFIHAQLDPLIDALDKPEVLHPSYIKKWKIKKATVLAYEDQMSTVIDSGVFEYDVNGRCISLLNDKIAMINNITYNHKNLPILIKTLSTGDSMNIAFTYMPDSSYMAITTDLHNNISDTCLYNKNDWPLLARGSFYTYEYDAEGKVTERHSFPLKAGKIKSTSSYRYNSEGLLIEKKLLNNYSERTTYYTYDTKGLLQRRNIIYKNENGETVTKEFHYSYEF